MAPSVCLSLCLSLSLSLSLCLSVRPSVRLSVSLSLSVSVCVCVCVCLSLSLSLFLFETLWGLCCHILRLSCPSRGYVSHIWDRCRVILRLRVPYLRPMLDHLEGLCPVILEHIIRHCCWHVLDAHEKSIMPVRAARNTDTTLEKHSVFCTSHAQNTVKHVGQRLFGGVRGRGRQSL